MVWRAAVASGTSHSALSPGCGLPARRGPTARYPAPAASSPTCRSGRTRPTAVTAVQAGEGADKSRVRVGLHDRSGQFHAAGHFSLAAATAAPGCRCSNTWANRRRAQPVIGGSSRRVHGDRRARRAVSRSTGMATPRYRHPRATSMHQAERREKDERGTAEPVVAIATITPAEGRAAAVEARRSDPGGARRATPRLAAHSTHLSATHEWAAEGPERLVHIRFPSPTPAVEPPNVRPIRSRQMSPSRRNCSPLAVSRSPTSAPDPQVARPVAGSSSRPR